MKKTGTWLISVCLTLCLYMTAQVAADSSLVLYLDFESGEGDIVEDRSDYGNDGTIQGEANWVEGKIGEGLEIDLSSVVIVPDCDEFKITDELTLACWAKCSAFAPETWQGNSLGFPGLPVELGSGRQQMLRNVSPIPQSVNNRFI